MAGEAEINELIRYFRELTAVTKELVSAQSAVVNQQMQAQLKQTDAAAAATKGYTHLTKKHITEATKDLKLTKEGIEAKKQALKDIDDLNNAQRAAAELRKQLNDLEGAEVIDMKARAALLDKINEAEAAEAKARNKASISYANLSEHTHKFGKSVNWVGASLRFFGTALTGQARQLAKQYQASGGVIEGSSNALANMWNLQVEGLKRGISGEELINAANANRRVVNALGGTEQAFKTLDPAIQNLRAQGISARDALELAGAQASNFAEYGVKPTQASMLAYNKELIDMRKYTGLTATQMHDMFNRVAEDEESRTLLKAAREDEREAILASQRALMKQAVAAGMSATQAEQAAKMLNKMTAAKPLDRLKQAAKIRALGGAMGIAGADEAAQAVIAGKRATAEQRQMLQEFSIAATNAMDVAAQSGLGTEIFASTLLEKLDLEAHFGPQSHFSTTLGDTVKPLQAAIDQQTDHTSGILGQAAATTTLLAGIAGVILPGIGSTIMTAAGVIVAAIASKAGAELLGKMGGVTGTGGGITSKAGKALSMGKNLLKGSAVGVTIGLAGDYVGDKLVEAGHDTAGGILSGAATGAGIGATIGSIIPGVGTLIGGGVGGLLGGAYGLYQSMSSPTSPSGKILKPAQIVPSKSMSSQDLGSLNMPDEVVKEATLRSADKLSEQVTIMDKSSTLLQTIADLTTRQVELSEKQLVALTMTEKQRTSIATRTALNQGSKFGSQYGYV